MHRKELTRQKIKRILIYYRELERLHISHAGAMMIMTYVFSLSPRWIEEILRTNDISGFEDVNLDYLSLDMLLIDRFVQQLHSAGKKSRNKQMQLF